MKTKKNDKRVSNYPFFFLEKKHQKAKVESVYTDKPTLAISRTNHTVTTTNGRIIHKKNISKPNTEFDQDCNNNNNRGTAPRGPDSRFTRIPSKPKKMYVIESDNEPETSPTETSSPTTLDQSDNATVKKSTFGRGKPLKLMRSTKLMSPPILTGRNAQHRSTHYNRCQYDRHLDRLCCWGC